MVGKIKKSYLQISNINPYKQELYVNVWSMVASKGNSER